MSNSKQLKLNRVRRNRAFRVRKKLHGTSARPRLCVVTSNSHIQVQLIDDDAQSTVGAIATYSKEFRETEFNRRNKASGRKLGERIAEIAKDKNIKEAIFDRGAYKYHGVLAEVADGARSGGLKI